MTFGSNGKTEANSPARSIKLTDIHTQVKILSSKLCLSEKEALVFLDEWLSKIKLPPNALGLCAIPSPEDNYRDLSLTALDLISREFNEFSGLECANTPEKFSVPQATLESLKKITVHQKGQILVVPIAFDSDARHCGTEESFLFGSLFTACLALTHQHLYSQDKNELAPQNTVECIGFGKVGCSKCWFDDSRLRWGKIRGFVPKF